MLTSIRVFAELDPLHEEAVLHGKVDAWKWHLRTHWFSFPGSHEAAAFDFNDKNEVLLLFPPARPTELVEPIWEFVQQQRLGKTHHAEGSCLVLGIPTRRSSLIPPCQGRHPWSQAHRIVRPKVVPTPHSPCNNESTIVFPVGYSSPGASNVLCLISSWFIAFAKVTLNILMVIILLRAWISKCAMFIFWHYIL